MADEEERNNLAHHGPPIFTERDLQVSKAMVKWIATARGSQPLHYTKDWLPGEVDMIKSRLFWRLRSGKKPLPEAPPRAYSCPWYEVVEEDRPHWAYEMHVNGDKVHIAQCEYEIEKMEGSEPSIVKFNCYRFKVWRGSPESPVAVMGAALIVGGIGPKGAWIQRIIEEKEKEKQS